eukprot:s90_g1.t1
MSITVEVGLLSGNSVTVQASPHLGRLLDSCGRVLDPCAAIKTAGIQNDDTLTLHIYQTQTQASPDAFAAILGDGSVVTWGSTRSGGDSSSVQDQLKNVQQIQASSGAFAAILGDGSAVTWGAHSHGGDSRAVQHQLNNVQQIQATDYAFAAILGDESVVTWGSASSGGDNSAVQLQLKRVQQIQATKRAFAAILGDGSVVTWGVAGCGGDSRTVQDRLRNVQQIQASKHAFAAILGDGSVVTWGEAAHGGDSRAVHDRLQNVRHIQASDCAFAAILADGCVVTWGHAQYGGDSTAVQDQLKTVQQIQATNDAFAAILGDGRVVTWGDAVDGGDSSAVQHQLKDVQGIQANGSAFAAILGDGSVVTWGDPDRGGDIRAVLHQLKNVQQIQATGFAFAAVLGDGSISTWGLGDFGGDSGAVRDQLKNVQQIQATFGAFAATLVDGSIVQDAIVQPVVDRIQAAAKHLGIEGEVVPFGSHTNSLCNSNSDCDVTFVPQEDVWGESALHILKLIAQELPSHGFKSIIQIFQASIPLIKAVDPGGVEVDLCIGNHLGIHNSRLVAAYCQLDMRVGEVCRAVKQWAKAKELVGSSDGHLNSYAYTLLTLYYLMSCRSPLVPNLQDLAQYPGYESVSVTDRKWGQKLTWDCKFFEEIELLPKSQNKDSVEKLLIGFFRYYTEEFDWSTRAVSVRLAMTQGVVNKFGPPLFAPVSKDMWFIEDPFDLRHNLSSNCGKEGRARILAQMAEALRLLEEGGLPKFHGIRSDTTTSFMLKCRIHIEKVSLDDFRAALARNVVREPMRLHYPAAGSRTREVADAFLIFESKESQRKVHELNETAIGEWQLRLMPCSSWALHDARAAGEYQEVLVEPPAVSKPVLSDGQSVGDQVRNGYRASTTVAAVQGWIEVAREHDLKHEEQMGQKRLQQLEDAAAKKREGTGSSYQ